MKSVLISIKPKWCELIASGKKTIEVRKTRPKIETPFKCYIYCTSIKNMPLQDYVDIHRKTGGLIDEWNGKVIGEFVCDSIYDITVSEDDYRHWWHETIYEECDEKQMCLTWDEVSAYLGHAYGYGWHISDLVIYDEPRELSKFKKYNRECFYSDLGLAISKCADCDTYNLTRPPQSWCYVEEI